MAEKKFVWPGGAPRTTGEFRAFLAETMIGVADGTIDVAQATAINKLAKQINDSFREEVKMAKARIDRGEAPFEFGKEKLPQTGRGESAAGVRGVGRGNDQP